MISLTPPPVDTIPDDMLADLRWMADTPHAIAVVPKSVLRILVDTYTREHCELRVVGDLSGVMGGKHHG